MRTILLATLLFVLIIGLGISWNIGPLASLRAVNVHTTQTNLNTPTVFQTADNTLTTRGGPAGIVEGSSTVSTSSTTVAVTTASSVDSTSGSSISTTNEVSRSDWIAYAQIAWQFFRPGVGVSPTTGLIYASPYWHRFTDWDLGGYILAVLSAENMGLIKTSGPWGAEYRLQLVLSFLQTRPLASNNLTFQFYDSDTGTVSPDGPPDVGNSIDEGRLLIALYDTKLLHPELATEIEAAVQHVNYAYFASDTRFGSGDVYSRYAARGFDLWGFGTLSPPNDAAPAYGSYITAEPAVSAVIEGVNDSYLTAASYQVYTAQYAAYNRTGILMALSEGQYPPYLNTSTPYVYEAIEVPTGSAYTVQTWQGQNVNSSPEAFTKIGFAFYAIYRSSYGLLLLNTLGNLTTSNGYMEGMLSFSSQAFETVSDNSNIMILEACAYAVNPI